MIERGYIEQLLQEEIILLHLFAPMFFQYFRNNGICILLMEIPSQFPALIRRLRLLRNVLTEFLEIRLEIAEPFAQIRFQILRFQIVKYSVELFKASPRGGRDGRFPLLQIAWFALLIHDVFKILSVKFLQSPQLQEQPMDEDEFLLELLFRILSTGGYLLLDERQCPVARLVIFHEGKLIR